MPLIEAGNNDSAENRDARPTQGPLCIIHSWESGAPGAEEQDAQDRIAHHVATFANIEMPLVKARHVQAKKKMQQRVKNPAGIAGREQGARFNGNHDEP